MEARSRGGRARPEDFALKCLVFFRGWVEGWVGWGPQDDAVS